MSSVASSSGSKSTSATTTGKRILEKVMAGINDSESRFQLIACPTAERRNWVQVTIRDALGPEVWDRVDVMTFGEIREGNLFFAGFDVLPTGEIPTMLYEL